MRTRHWMFLACHFFNFTSQYARAQTTCGNGTVDGAELCDDGNTRSNDGCSETCNVEAGYVCTGKPSLCCFQEAATSYVLTGAATLDPNTFEVTLTPEQTHQVGVAWFNGTLDFSEPFSISQRIYLGSRDNDPTANVADNGGDGSAILFQRDSRGRNAIGAFGAEFGAYGIMPVIGVEFDTFDNGPSFQDGSLPGDEDHVSIFQGRPTNNLLAPACMNEGAICTNFEDGRYHSVSVVWSGGAVHQLSVFIDGSRRLRLDTDIVATSFGGDPKNIIFGFSASSGNSFNLQKICPAAPDGYRALVDTDGDGIPDNIDPDDDNDGMTDASETAGIFDADDPGDDHDLNGIPNYRDSDYWSIVLKRPQDCPDLLAPIGACDSYIAEVDRDRNGLPNHLQFDSTTVPPPVEDPDTDGDGVPNGIDLAPNDPCIPIRLPERCPALGEVDSGVGTDDNDAGRAADCTSASSAPECADGGRERRRSGGCSLSSADSAPRDWKESFCGSMLLLLVSVFGKRRRRS